MSGETFLTLFQTATFYLKRLRDYVEAQRSNGGFTETAPFVGLSDSGLGGDSGPIGWQTYAVVDALWLFTYYGRFTITFSFVNLSCY